MERNLEKTMEDVNNAEGVTGCILTDQAGLCLGGIENINFVNVGFLQVKGNASCDSAGLIAAIADQAGKLQPGSESPVVSLQNDSRQCLIQRQGPVVGAIYKNIPH